MLDKILYFVMMLLITFGFAIVGIKIAKYNPDKFLQRAKAEDGVWKLVKKRSNYWLLLAFFVDMGTQLSLALGDLWFNANYYPSLLGGLLYMLLCFVVYYVATLLVDVLGTYFEVRISPKSAYIFYTTLLVITIVLLVVGIIAFVLF